MPRRPSGHDHERERILITERPRDLRAARGRAWPIDRTAFLFVGAMHLLGIAGAVYLFFSFSWWTVLLAGVMYLACGLSITAGYHRLFAHRSYRASPLVRLLMLAFGAAAFQNSALNWSADHRVHHRHGDEDEDPYSVNHGFWWAHVGWVVSRKTPNPKPRDLESDPLVAFQHRHWFVIALVVGLGLPAAVAAFWGDPIGGLLVAGCLRIALTWHGTWAVNSLAHCVGRRTYDPELSARDNFWVALLTLGEGYHNFHHRFQADFRNGVRWFHYDPTKWLLLGLARLGLVRDLVRVPEASVLRARDEVAAMRRQKAS